jgi:hypothetical protein
VAARESVALEKPIRAQVRSRNFERRRFIGNQS